MQNILSEVEIRGESVVISSDGRESILDFSQQVELLSYSLEFNLLTKEMLLIFVVGCCQYHMKMFAKVLTESGTNTCLIDGNNIAELNESNDFSSIINDVNTTYLIENFDPSCDANFRAIDRHVKGGGICILFGKDKDDYKGEVLPKTFPMGENCTRPGVVLYFGDSMSGRGLNEQPLSEDVSCFTTYLNENNVELERFEDGSISSLILPEVYMDDHLVQSAKELAESQTIDFRVRTSEYIKEWRKNSNKRFWC